MAHVVKKKNPVKMVSSHPIIQYCAKVLSHLLLSSKEDFKYNGNKSFHFLKEMTKECSKDSIWFHDPLFFYSNRKYRYSVCGLIRRFYWSVVYTLPQLSWRHSLSYLLLYLEENPEALMMIYLVWNVFFLFCIKCCCLSWFPFPNLFFWNGNDRKTQLLLNWLNNANFTK